MPPQFQPEEVRKKGLALRIMALVLGVVAIGILLILLSLVLLLLFYAVPDWGDAIEANMILLEQNNTLRLAQNKADFVTEVFQRIKESTLQLQAFGEQVLSESSTTMGVEGYVQPNGGLNESESETWEHSVWYITGYKTPDEVPPPGSPLGGMLNRSALMDVLFRGLSRQHELVYVGVDQDPDVNMQQYPGSNLSVTPYSNWNEPCDERYSGYGDASPETFDPRCRVWYQDARDGAGGVIFTEPYQFATSQVWSISTAAAVFDPVSGDFLGVASLDMHLDVIETPINYLTVVGGAGYAYMLAPGTNGSVVVHPELDRSSPEEATKKISDLEDGLENFEGILQAMDSDCSGSETYTKGGDTWILSWARENTSAPICNDGYILVVTVSEDDLLQAFSAAEEEIEEQVYVATMIMAVAAAGILCITGCFARAVSTRITKPVTQLVDVVRSLNRVDFSRGTFGPWNEARSPEMKEMIEAFKEMMTIVQFANELQGTGNITAALQNYKAALTLFTKLGNGGGISVVRNNLGNVHTLLARELVEEAYRESDTITGQTVLLSAPKEARLREADQAFEKAETLYRKSIAYAQALYNGQSQRHPLSPLGEAPIVPVGGGGGTVGDSKSGSRTNSTEGAESVTGGLEAGTIGVDATADGNISCGDGRDAATARGRQGDRERQRMNDYHVGMRRGSRRDSHRASADDLLLVLVNRKFNLAVCLADKGGTGGVLGRERRHPKATDEARRLLTDECCVGIGTKTEAVWVEQRVECWLALAALERDVPDRQEAAKEALAEALKEITSYATRGTGDTPRFGESQPVTLGGKELPVRLAVLRQRVLAERGAQKERAGETLEAIHYWNDAVVDCGSRMHRMAVRASLEGLQRQVVKGNGNGRFFSPNLRRALGVSDAPSTSSAEEEKSHSTGPISSGGVADDRMLTKAIDAALEKLDITGPAVYADLCFVMDCTKSMQTWINRAKTQMIDIIDQAHRKVPNLKLRVAFVGYRDFGDRVRYEGPYDFCAEDEVPKLLAKLENVVEQGGDDIPEDMAGGLAHAVKMSWWSPTRLCILVADAPCHGTEFHEYADNYPRGDPSGLDPVHLLYTLQYELGVDFYFIQISSVTDDMINKFRDGVDQMAREMGHDTGAGSDGISRAFGSTGGGDNGSRPLSNVGGGRPRRGLQGCFTGCNSTGRRADVQGLSASLHHSNANPKFVVHRLGEEDNNFLPAVVLSVKESVGIIPCPARVEDYYSSIYSRED